MFHQHLSLPAFYPPTELSLAPFRESFHNRRRFATMMMSKFLM